MNIVIDKKDRRTLVKSLKRKDFKTAVEVGARDGTFSKYILDNTDMKVYSIDPFEHNSELTDPDSIYKLCLDILSPYKDRSVVVKAYSPEISNEFEDESLDFVYIDALHTYEAVREDINSWWPKVKKSGVISGHDFNREVWPGVVKAVEEFCDFKSVEFSLTGCVNYSTNGDLDEFDGHEQSWFIIK